MTETHCTNAACPEVDLAKECLGTFPPGSVILCGACGLPTSEPAETTVSAGGKVAGRGRR